MFRVPDPEEIFEAYREGFIDFEDYRELLEITRAEFLNASDSLFLLRFPDLLAGFSAHPVLDGEEADMADEHASSAPMRPKWRHAALFRQYHRLDDESGNRRIYRLQEEYGEAAFYGEFEEAYSDRRTWYRRGIEYRVRSDAAHEYAVIVGNYRAQFALGLIYGHRGQLLAQADDPTRTESLLYPDYSGGNGVMVAADRPEGQYLFVMDIDRNALFEKRYAGLSIPMRIGPLQIRLSGGWGKLANLFQGSSLTVSPMSIAGMYENEIIDFMAEAATDARDRRHPTATAARLSWRHKRVYFRGEGWFYEDGYPTYFTGSLSSRRSRTIHVDEIDFSYGDRYRGERGIALGSTVRASSQTIVRTALMYAGRGFDDDRIEARLGIRRKVHRRFRLGADIYWRGDRLYSDDRTQRRIQFEIVATGGGLRNRLVVGRRLSTYGDYDDYLIVLESGARGRWGAASVSCKFDRLRPERWTNQYLYATAKYEVDIGNGIFSYVKYSHRYERDNPGGSYGTVRWDVRWVIQ